MNETEKMINEARKIGKSWSKINRVAQDRSAWQVTVDALCQI